MRKGDKFLRAGVPMDRLTVAPTPSGVSWAYTAFVTERVDIVLLLVVWYDFLSLMNWFD